ncbi:MAG: rhodanese-related sulfurtransferase [Pseudomonadota bacterium]|nr:MAG: rhodanese-related sulfurtransferase [Pseudomonadota bacterium]
MPELLVAAFYKFVQLSDCEKLRQLLADECARHGVLGTILLAAEGINGTIAGNPNAVRAVLHYLRSDPRLGDLKHKESDATEPPFYRMKVRLKKEIVTMGVAGVDPRERVGTYVNPADWNALIDDPEVLLLDTRNEYETAVGTFDGAVDPRIASFREFPTWIREHLDPAKHKKVAMFCTGGIRCEKATSFLLSEGFEEVFHLQGGILRYLEQVPEQSSKWQGECFVFDNRVSLGHHLQQGSHTQCHACRHPLSKADLDSPHFRLGVSCPWCYKTFTDAQRASAAERERQVNLARERHTNHIGPRQPASHQAS